MGLRTIHLDLFRNYSEIEVELHPGRTLIYGDNGQGKSNFIEAVFVLLQGYSFRTHKPADLIPWSNTEWRVRGTTFAGDQIGLQYLGNGEKTLSLNGERTSRFSDLLGLNPAMAIGPGDIELSQGGPAVRRRFFDSQLCQFHSTYLGELRLYQKSLKQRNAYLKSLKGGARPEESLLSALTEQLALHGAEILRYRAEWLVELSPLVEEFYHLMSQGKEPLRIRSSRWSEQVLSSENSEEELFRQMMAKRDYDLLTGSTSVGLHKDDFIIELKEKSLRDFGSQGQQRSFALALKLGTAHWMAEFKKLKPVLLLDDIFAELDVHRRKSLVDHIMAFEQVFLTTPGAEKDLIQTDHVLKIEGGKVTF